MAVEKIAEERDELVAEKNEPKFTERNVASDYKSNASAGLGVFARITLFFKQILLEIKKVVYPTRDEVITYTGVVLVFVLVLMGFITGVDFGVGKAVTAIFG
jgi:preprotein translocase subunit SecE